MNLKDKYINFCQEVYVPIFSQSWWMDVVCGETNWDVYIVENGGKVIAAMPYYFKDNEGLKVIAKAKLTQNNGIIIKYPENQKYCSKLDYEDKIINEICDFIEAQPLKRYEQQFHYSFDNWLPFFWRKFEAIIRYTYLIEDTSDLNIIQNAFSSNARNMLKKAMKEVYITEDINLEEFYLVNKKTFLKQELTIPFGFDLVEGLYEACKAHDCCKIIAAKDKDNNTHSVALLVWDEASVYFLVNGTDPEFKDSQANTLVIYEGIKTASALGKKFDFEGSVIKSVEKAFRQFGGKRKPYFRIYKEFDK
jgi:hypothetical protein